MRSFSTLVITSHVILESIEISSCAQPKTRDFLKNFGTSSDYPSDEESHSQSDFSERSLALDRVHSPTRFPPREEPPLRVRSRSPHAEPSLRARSRSPPFKHRIPTVLGYKFEELRFLRLIPHNNSTRMFEFREYTFPPGKPIRFRTMNDTHKLIPAGKQIVLSMANGDVFAMLEKNEKDTVFRGIYKYIPTILGEKRAKINMHNGRIDELTPEEIVECPLGNQSKVAKKFKVFRV